MNNVFKKCSKFPDNLIKDIFDQTATVPETAVAVIKAAVTERVWTIIQMYYCQGLSQYEIAANIGISPARVSEILRHTKWRLYRMPEIKAEPSDVDILRSKYDGYTFGVLYRAGLLTSDAIINTPPEKLYNLHGMGEISMLHIMNEIGTEYRERWFPDTHMDLSDPKIIHRYMYMYKRYYQK